MPRRTRLSRTVNMPPRRLNPVERLLLAYTRLGDRMFSRLIKGDLTPEEKQEIADISKQSSDDASFISSYLTRKKEM